MDYDTKVQRLSIYSAFVNYVRRNTITVKQYISYL